jgi:hypothetical protein
MPLAGELAGNGKAVLVGLKGPRGGSGRHEPQQVLLSADWDGAARGQDVGVATRCAASPTKICST